MRTEYGDTERQRLEQEAQVTGLSEQIKKLCEDSDHLRSIILAEIRLSFRSQLPTKKGI